MKRRLAFLAPLVLLAACGGEPPSVTPSTSPDAALASPGSSLVQFVTAAGRRDAPGTWAVLSRTTRRRLGPTLTRFEAGAAAGIERRASLVVGSSRLLFAEVIGPELAVAAVTGEREQGGKRAFAAYAAPMRRERGEWRVVIDRGVTILPVRPDPNETVVGRTKLAADISAHAPISAAGLWFDGRALDGTTGSVDPRHLGIIAEAPQPLAPARHTAVAFASDGTRIAALAWAFAVAG